MSEFSSSFHIRTSDPAATLRQLRAAKFAGIVYGPANGWLTFVPYGHLPAYARAGDDWRFAQELSARLRANVLHYAYAEDHGWSFAFLRPGERLCRFACWWDPEPSIERDQFDPGALASLVPLESILPLLEPVVGNDILQEPRAYRFAELLGLPIYRWLSPDLAQRETDDCVALGGRKIGTRPPTVAERLRAPPMRQLSLPRPDLSAAEALAIVMPIVATIKGRNVLVRLGSHGVPVRPDGRMDALGGGWSFEYRNEASGSFVQAALQASGVLYFRVEAGRMAEIAALPTRGWLDSTDIATVMAQDSLQSHASASPIISMGLEIQSDQLVWDVRRLVDPSHVRTLNTYTVDARGGELLLETVLESRHGMYTVTRWRSRRPLGDWVNATLGN